MSTFRERLRALGHAYERLEHKPLYWPFDALWRLLRHETAHDRHWRAHPAVATDEQLTFGQRAADVMRSGLGTWTFLIVLAGLMAVWVVTGGFGRDAFPFILLNLCLSTLAGVQAAVLLIAAKRSDQVAAAVSLHTLDNTERLTQLLEQNTALTEQVAQLTREVHAHIAGDAQTAQTVTVQVDGQAVAKALDTRIKGTLRKGTGAKA